MGPTNSQSIRSLPSHQFVLSLNRHIESEVRPTGVQLKRKLKSLLLVGKRKFVQIVFDNITKMAATPCYCKTYHSWLAALGMWAPPNLIYILMHLNRNKSSFRLLLKLKSVFVFMMTIVEPQHEISNNVVCATSKGSDQPAHMRSLIRAFASRVNIL